MAGGTLNESGRLQTDPDLRPNIVAQMWARLVDGLAVLGTAMIGVLMAMICADIVARNLLGASLPLISELSAITLVMIVFLQLGTAVRHGRLARIEFFSDWLGRKTPRGALLLNMLWALAGLACCALIAWSTWSILLRDYNHDEFIGVTGIMTMPVWPFRAMILLGVSVAALQFLVLALRDLFAVFRPQVQRSVGQ